MTDTKQKALALVNEVRSPFSARQIDNLDDAMSWEAVDALLRAIEQHEAFRQEVSDAVEEVTQRQGKLQSLLRFIIAKPDPLVEALGELADRCMEARQAAETLRAAMKARGYEWRKIEGEG